MRKIKINLRIRLQKLFPLSEVKRIIGPTENGYDIEAVDVLEKWTLKFPADTNATSLLRQYRARSESPDS